MLEPSLLNETTEMFSKNFTADELDRIGGMLFKDYSSHNICGEASHMTFSSGKAASILVSHSNSKKKTLDLIKLLIELDDSMLNGKAVEIKGLEEFLNKLSSCGIIYDFHKRKLHSTKKEKENLINWGSLKDGKVYNFSILSIDICGNSKLVRKYGAAKMEKVYFHLRKFLQQKVYEYDGRIWNFAGDGGLIALTFKGHEQRAVLCALDIQLSLPVFNLRNDVPIKDDIVLRVGIDCGKFRFSLDTGHIVADTINYAAHLEKLGTKPGQISFSSRIKKEINSKTAKLFKNKSEFEGTKAYSTDF